MRLVSKRFVISIDLSDFGTVSKQAEVQILSDRSGILVIGVRQVDEDEDAIVERFNTRYAAR